MIHWILCSTILYCTVYHIYCTVLYLLQVGVVVDTVLYNMIVKPDYFVIIKVLALLVLYILQLTTFVVSELATINKQ